MSQNRLTAFVKRISLLALQLEHNGTLGALAIVRTVMQLGKAADILLDTDASIGDGFYDPELTEPEYCNAQRTALWEMVPLQVFHLIFFLFESEILNNLNLRLDYSLISSIFSDTIIQWFRKWLGI